MACRGCLECLLKLLNFLLAVVGLGMIGYGIYLFVEYKRATDNSVTFSPINGDDQSYVSFGRPMLMAVALSSNVFDNLPKAWFIYLFIGIGVALFVISCCGCVGTCSRSVCCLSCYSLLLILLILAELGAAAFIFFDNSWRDVDGESDEFDDGNDEESESGDEGNDDNKDAAMEELEKEYQELRSQEQDILKNLKRDKNEDVAKGQAVKNQKALWDKTLEFRFLLQKAFSSSNRLPQENVKSSFCSEDEKVSSAYAELITSSKKTLDSLVELQEALFEKNPSVDQQANESNKSDAEDTDEWHRISDMQKRMCVFRNKAVDKWQRRTQVTTGAAAIKGKLHAFNQNVSEQVASYMRDPSRMIKQMQQSRSTVAVFGTVPEETMEPSQEEKQLEGDPELVEDAEFYQQLLKEFFETIDPASSEAAFYAMKKFQTKKRKIVDRRASKSRKIRYNVHEKIVNFMAPRPVKIPPNSADLLKNLFGLKTRNSLSEA